MRRISIAIITLSFYLITGTWFGHKRVDAKWEGVDKTVVEKFATEANRPPRDPFINTDQGDLLLFVFLVAGAAAGFAGGYYFRTLFPPKGKKDLTNV